MAGTESFPLEALDNWQMVEEHPYVIGDFVWTSLDYLGEAGIGRVDYTEDGEPNMFLGAYPWHQANCGDLDLCGFKRPQSYYRDILWSEGAQVYIVVHPPAPEGMTVGDQRGGAGPTCRRAGTGRAARARRLRVDVYSSCEQVELLLNDKSLGTKRTGKTERYTATFEVPVRAGRAARRGHDRDSPVRGGGAGHGGRRLRQSG